MTESDVLGALPLLPRDGQGPVFAEPWQAQVFAVVVELTQRGELTPKEWADHLGAALKNAEKQGEYDTGERYYDHWLTALECFLVERNLTDWEDLAVERETIRADDDHRRDGQLHDHQH